jgi:hypothetical protein
VDGLLARNDRFSSFASYLKKRYQIGRVTSLISFRLPPEDVEELMLGLIDTRPHIVKWRETFSKPLVDSIVQDFNFSLTVSVLDHPTLTYISNSKRHLNKCAFPRLCTIEQALSIL